MKACAYLQHEINILFQRKKILNKLLYAYAHKKS